MTGELCRHELTLGTCADCQPDGTLRRLPPEHSRHVSGEVASLIPVTHLFAANYPGRCVADDACRFEGGDQIGPAPDGGYVCEDHAELIERDPNTVWRYGSRP